MKTLMILLMILSASVAAGQEKDNDQLEIISDEKEVTEQSINKTDRFDANVTIGTGFLYSPGNFYGPSFSISPGFSYLVTPRFLVSAGFAAERINLYTGGEDNFLPMTRAFLYARGSYLISDKVVFSGTAFKSIGGNYPVGYDLYGRPLRNYNTSGMEFGVDYKVTRSFSIGVHMRVQDRSLFPGENSFIYPY